MCGAGHRWGQGCSGLFSETIGRAFKEFLIRCGIRFQIVTDNHNSYVGKGSEFITIMRAQEIVRNALHLELVERLKRASTLSFAIWALIAFCCFERSEKLDWT